MASQAELNYLSDLAAQWMQQVGYTVEVSQGEIEDLAREGASTMFDIGQYFGRDSRYASAFRTYPWAQFGMSATEYDTKVQTLGSTFLQLTGQALPQDILTEALRQNQGTMTGPQFQTFLLSHEAIKNTYGWLKYGLDFQQFQQRKLDMATSLGHPLSDQEAVTQLQYMHQAQGPNVGVAPQQTLTQVERKQAQVGVGQSVVR